MSEFDGVNEFMRKGWDGKGCCCGGGWGWWVGQEVQLNGKKMWGTVLAPKTTDQNNVRGVKENAKSTEDTCSPGSLELQ